MIVIGIIGLASGTFAPIFEPVSRNFPDRELVNDLCILVSLVSGAGLIFERTARWAALALLIFLCIWAGLFKLPFIVRHPLVEGSYQSFGENAVQIAAACTLYFCARQQSKGDFAQGPWGSLGLKVGYALYGLALVAFGFSHFAYLDLTAPLVPSWLLVPTFWAYFSGCIYVTSGLAIVSGLAQRLGTLVAAIEITLITFLVWGPMVLSGAMTSSRWQETIISWVLTSAALVVAASLGNQPWVKTFGRFQPSDPKVDTVR